MSNLISPNKGIIQLSDYGLIHYLIAKNYDISLIMHMMTSYQILTNTEQVKEMPAIAIALNRNPNFNKGVTKALKMISSLNWICLFSIPKGILSNDNKFSVLRHMVKRVKSLQDDKVAADHVKSNLTQLIQKGFFQMAGYSPKLAESFNKFRSVNQEIMSDFQDLTVAITEADNQKLCATQPGINVMRNEVHAILRAIKSGNAEAFKSILECNAEICLREALGGPKTNSQAWNYNYHVEGSTITLPFESLGLAMMLDDSIKNDEQ